MKYSKGVVRVEDIVRELDDWLGVLALNAPGHKFSHSSILMVLYITLLLSTESLCLIKRACVENRLAMRSHS